MREIDYNTLKVGDKIITRDGRDGRVICTDLKRDFPIVVAILSKDGTEHTQSYYKNGYVRNDVFSNESDIFLPPQKEYVGLYKDINGGYVACKYQSKADAENCISSDCLKLVEIEL